MNRQLETNCSITECNNLNNNEMINCHEEHSDYLFCPDILKALDFSSDILRKFSPPISPANPGKNLIMRPLREDDYDKGYVQLLSQLTETGKIDAEDFKKAFWSMRRSFNTYYVVVIEDFDSGCIVGTSTLLLEQKFIHELGRRGRIEDVVVDDRCRGKQLGKLLVETCTQMGSQYFKCYKMSLDCKDKLVGFYGEFGYKKEPGQNVLIQRIERLP